MSYSIIYSSSNEYSPFLITSMYSLLKNNPTLSNVKFWILTHDMTENIKSKISNICVEFEAEVEFIDSKNSISEIFQKGGTLNFNPSSFLRIFIPQLLPDTVEKALFIDSDTYIEDGIKELYDTDISECYCAMCYNVPIYPEFLKEANLSINDGYFNAGVILLNLSKWRNDNVQQKILDYYYRCGGDFSTDDQSVINAIVSKETKVLDYKYNAMIIIFYHTYNKFCRISTNLAKKTRKEFFEAKFNPVIIHFNGPGIRPWEKWCGHPYTNKYRKLLFFCNPGFIIKKPKQRFLYTAIQYLKHITIDRLKYLLKL